METLHEEIVRFNEQVVFDSNGRWMYRNRTVAAKNRPFYSSTPKEYASDLQGHHHNKDSRFVSEWMEEYDLRFSSGKIHPITFVGVIPIFRALQDAGLRVNSLKNILRDDLAAALIHQWQAYGLRYGTERNHHVRPEPGTISWPFMGGQGAFSFHGEKDDTRGGVPCSRPVMAFHGTSFGQTHSIVRNGLVAGGSTNRVGVCNGQPYGAGIYCSPDPLTAASYGGNGILIVCAVLMGRAGSLDGRCGPGECDTNTDPSSFREWIVFDRCSIVPCWAVGYSSCNDAHSNIRVTKSEASVKLEGKFSSNKMSEVKAEDMSEDELSRKGAFWFGSGRQILEMAPHDDDDDDEFGFVPEKSVVTENGRHSAERYREREF